MTAPLLFTKLYIPPTRPNMVLRSRLTERLNEGLQRQLTLVSAPAGFGKTSVISQWLAGCGRPAAWLSLDEGDNDTIRFLSYLVAALQTMAPQIGAGAVAALQSPQPPPTEWFLTALVNEMAAIPDDFIVVLDDYHRIASGAVDTALTFLLAHTPPQAHLVIATREDPPFPLARLRARGQLNELRAADLRFTLAEAADFLNRAMGLNLSAEDIAALESRTEGWIAGLQLAAISMQGHEDATAFIKSFTGSHHFVLDYLVEEVLGQQSDSIQTFLLRTAILERMCGPLCDAVVHGDAGEHHTPGPSGQETLTHLERANLFIVPLDDERRWYRYHHLFAELLRQRLQQSGSADEYHIRASQWYEDNNLAMEAFHHAVAANDVERAARLIEGKGIPLHFPGAVNAILAWLASLSRPVLDANPLLWVRSATMALTAGQTSGVEEKLQAAEAAIAAALPDAEPDEESRDLIGQIACARATLAVTRYQPAVVVAEARRALENLLPGNLRFRFTANWALATAYHFQGDRAASGRTIAEAISLSKGSASKFSTILAVTHQGRLQELDNQLYRAAETYRRVLQMASNQPGPSANDASLGLARICYEWNDLNAAEQYAQLSLQLARQYDPAIDRFIISEVFLARLKLARGDVAGAAAMLAETAQTVRQNEFVQRRPEVVAAQSLTLLRQGEVADAARLVAAYDLPASQARVFLAQGETAKAVALLWSLRQQMEARGWQEERLRVIVLLAVARQAQGETETALSLLREALELAEPGGFIRLFVDEGAPMAELLSMAAAQGIMPDYADKLRKAFPAEMQDRRAPAPVLSPKAPLMPAALVEPLSPRELEILRLVGEGLSNREIGERLFLALDTVKGHNRRIFDKLHVQRRTEAIARARELGLL